MTPNLRFNSAKLALEYIRFPIGTAFMTLKRDLVEVRNKRDFKVVQLRWRLAERKFVNDLRGLPVYLATSSVSFTRKEEYEYFLREAAELLRAKSRALGLRG